MRAGRAWGQGLGEGARPVRAGRAWGQGLGEGARPVRDGRAWGRPGRGGLTCEGW